MGRAQGCSPSVAPTPASASRSSAHAPAAPARIPAGLAHRLRAVGDRLALVLPGDLAALLPSATLDDGTRVLALAVPPERAGLYGFVFERLWVKGQVEFQSELARLLSEEDGLSARDLGRGSDHAISDEDLRLELPEMTHRLALPAAIYDPGHKAAGADPGRPKGMRRPHSRAEVQHEVRRLRERAAHTEASASGAAQGEPWLRGERSIPEYPALSDGKRRVLEALLAALGSKDEAMRDEDLALRFAEERLTMGDWSGTESPSAISGPNLRKIVSFARGELHIPIASGRTGYWISSPSEVVDDAQRLAGRAREMRAHAQFLDDAAALTWPAGDEERAARRALRLAENRKAPRPWSESYAGRRERSQAQSRANAEDAGRGRLTREQRKELARRTRDALDGVARALLASCRGADRRDVLTEHQNEQVDEWIAAHRWVEKDVAPPADTDYPWAPVRRLRSVAGGAVQVQGAKPSSRRGARRPTASSYDGPSPWDKRP